MDTAFDSSFNEIVKHIIAQHGIELLDNQIKFKGLLSDYTKGRFKAETRLFLTAVNIGYAKLLHTDKHEFVKKQLVTLLQREYFIIPQAAEEVISLLELIINENAPIIGDLNFEIIDGHNIAITEYLGNSDSVDIPRQIRGLPVTDIGSWAFSFSNLKTLNLPSSISIIWNNAFYSCKNLTGIDIPLSLTSIGERAFDECENLKGIDIPQSLLYIAEEAFSLCTSLECINVDFQNPRYASISGVLFDKNVHSLITYPSGRKAEAYTVPPSLISIEDWSFSHSKYLVSVTILPSVKYIKNGAFAHCANLTSIEFPSSLVSIGYEAFEDCYNLKRVTLSSRTHIRHNSFPEWILIDYSP